MDEEVVLYTNPHNRKLGRDQAGDGRVNINILVISELKCMAMGKFNSDDHYTYYCRQEFLRRNEPALIVNKRV